ncbi:pyridoxamine 5'-phosphate oxidase family protein [Thalassobaculum sp.]|uniref:pyridoxamine 5'-phosphate oxidase family protein n=1 Tax=Thalassobaculum sp. TaxID=2022740 RepID=UPI0032EDE278
MTPPDDLNALAEHILGQLSDAVSAPASPWRTPMLASLTADGEPTLRTVVLRSVRPADRALRVNTDIRSDKAGQIDRQRQVELCFWNPATAQQVRIAGDARVEDAGPAADAAWSALPPEGRSIYRHGAAPGTPIGRPGTPARPAADGDRSAFALVTVVWRRWDWIWLGPDSHWRARFRWDADGSRQAEWVVP